MYLASVISEESEKGEMLFQYPGVAPRVTDKSICAEGRFLALAKELVALSGMSQGAKVGR